MGRSYLYFLTSLAGGNYLLPDHAFHNSIGPRLQEAEQYADVTLCVGEDKAEIRTTRHLLAVHCDFFKDYFKAESEGALARGSDNRVVPLRDLNSTVVKNLVRGMLTGTVEVESYKLDTLFHAADFLGFRSRDCLCLAVSRAQSRRKAQEGDKKALAAFLFEADGLAERYKMTSVSKFVWHLITEDPELWELQREAWLAASENQHQAAMKKLQATHKLLGGQYPKSQCALIKSLSANKKEFCVCEEF